MTRHLLSTAMLLAVAVLNAFPEAQAGEAPKKNFRAGAFAIDITPTKLPISVNGGMTDRQATAVHDRLHARCLVLDDGTTKIALVVCDSCMVPREIFDAAKAAASRATGIPTKHMLMSATHTHTAPTVGGVFQSDPDEAYVKYLAERIAKGIEVAHSGLKPARIGWGVGKDLSQVFNRRWRIKPGEFFEDPFGRSTDQVKMNPGYQHPKVTAPAGPTDPDVTVLSVQSLEGKPLALLANYSLHYVGGVQPLSADYFGVFADRVKQLVGGDEHFVGIMSNGTSGDINNINYGGPAPARQGEYEQIKIVADSVARVAHKTWQEIKHQEWVSLAAAEKEIELGVRLPSAVDVERAHDILTKAKTDRPLQSLAEIYARETVLLTKYPPTVKAKLQAIRIGELGICACPCETFVDIGLELKKQSPLKPTFTVSLANGYNGYLPTPQQHKLGGYETWRARSSYLEVDAATKITATLVELLGEAARRNVQ